MSTAFSTEFSLSGYHRLGSERTRIRRRGHAGHRARVRVYARGPRIWCLPEVDLGLPLTPEMFRVVAAHLPSATLRDALLLAAASVESKRRMLASPTTWDQRGGLLETAVKQVRSFASKDRQVIIEHKRLLYPQEST